MDNASPGAKNSRNKKLEAAQPSSTTFGPVPGGALTRCATFKTLSSNCSRVVRVFKVPPLMDASEREAEREAIEES